MVIFFICFVPVRLFCLKMTVFVPCDCKLQRAYFSSWSMNLNICRISKIIIRLRFNYQISKTVYRSVIEDIKTNNN